MLIMDLKDSKIISKNKVDNLKIINIKMDKTKKDINKHFFDNFLFFKTF